MDIILSFEKRSMFSMSRATYFSLRDHTGTDVSHSNTGKARERFWKNAGDGTCRVESSQEEIPGSRRSMHGNMRTCSRLKREKLLALGSEQMGL